MSGGRFAVLRELPASPLHRTLRARDEAGEELEVWLPAPALTPSAEARARWVENARHVKAMTAGSGHLRKLLDAGVDGEQCWVSVALAAGQSLAARVNGGRACTDAVVAYLAMSLSDGLTAAHVPGLVHGYLRADDVTMAGEMPRIAGCGLWRTIDRAAALAAFRGAAHLLAPELRAGEAATARSDVYSLAVILAELALGLAAESGAEAAVLRNRLRQERPRLDAVLAPAFALSPAERPASAPALAAQLADLIPKASRRTTTALEEVTPALGTAPVAERDDTPFDEVGEPATLPASIWNGPVVTLRKAAPKPGAALPRPPSAYPRSSEEVPAVDDAAETRPIPRVEPVAPPPRAPTPLRAQPPPRAQVHAPLLSAPTKLGAIATYAAIAGVLTAAVALGSWYVIKHARPGEANAQIAPTPAPAHVTNVVVAPTAAAPPPAAPPVVISQIAAPPSPALAGAAGPCPPGMVLIDAKVGAANGARSCIDAYEAGGGAGQLPTIDVTLEQARAGCAAANKRLCTGSEWELACRGASHASYPYGSSFVETRCNVHGTAIEPSGQRASCVSAAGAHDMGGNAAEWVAEGVLRGGSAIDHDDGRCSHHARTAGGTDAGYRCCASPSP